jgi:two-component system, NarL family, sensor kinase
VAASVAQFVIAGLAVTVALVASSGMLARRAGVAEAIGSFEDLARVAAAALSPSLDARPDADPQTRATLNRQLTALRDAGPAVRVEVLAPTGEVLWSSLPRLEGETFALQARQQQALWTGSAGSQVSAPSPDRNGFPPGQGPLLQAFVGVRDVHGSPLLVTLYESYAVVTGHAEQLW